MKRLDAAHVGFARDPSGFDSRQVCTLGRQCGICFGEGRLDEKNVGILDESDYGLAIPSMIWAEPAASAANAFLRRKLAVRVWIMRALMKARPAQKCCSNHRAA